MKSWFNALDGSSQVMVLGISFLMVLVIFVLTYSAATGEGLDSSWDSSFSVDAETLAIVDSGGSYDN